jgi:hypothetical protein
VRPSETAFGTLPTGSITAIMGGSIRVIIDTEKYRNDINLFQGHYIFKLEGGKWGAPQSVYIDTPFMDTGLREWFEVQRGAKKKSALSDEYRTCGVKPEQIGGFAEKLGISMKMHIEKTSVSYEHPEWNDLRRRGGKRFTGYGRDEDYYIPGLIEFLGSPSVGKSRLVWRTIKESCSDNTCYLHAHYGQNASNIASGRSTLVHDLRRASWVPQKNGKQIDYVQPRDAVAEKLVEGFEFQTGWEWLQALEFGESVEKRREALMREKQRQTQEYKRKEEIARDLGFDSPEEAEEIAKLMKENPEEFRKFKESTARKERPPFPIRPVTNPGRRQERFGEQLSNAPEKEYEKRERRVRTTNGVIYPITWLRNQYTNEADQMICQICKEEMPFRKRNKKHYFEKKEVLSKKYLPKEHEAQYLALCPLCAAKYDEFVKKDDTVMTDLRKEIIDSDDCEVAISLGDEKTSIRFVETHYHDLKAIIEDAGPRN